MATTWDRGPDLVDRVDRLIERATTEPTFRRRLVAEPAATAAEVGLTVPAGVELRVVEQGPNELYLPLPSRRAPTIAPSDPTPQDPAGQFGRLADLARTDPIVRERLVSDPEGALREAGLVVPPHVQVKLLEATDDVRYLVLPPLVAPDGELSDEELAQISGGVGPGFVLPTWDLGVAFSRYSLTIDLP